MSKTTSVSHIPIYRTRRSSPRTVYYRHGYSTQIPRFQALQLTSKSRHPCRYSAQLNATGRHREYTSYQRLLRHWWIRGTPLCVRGRFWNYRTSLVPVPLYASGGANVFSRCPSFTQGRRGPYRGFLCDTSRALALTLVSPPGILVGTLFPRYDRRCTTPPTAHIGLSHGELDVPCAPGFLDMRWSSNPSGGARLRLCGSRGGG